MANDENVKDSGKVLEAIAALKDIAESDVEESAKGVDLGAIVKKLSRNRERVRSKK